MKFIKTLLIVLIMVSLAGNVIYSEEKLKLTYEQAFEFKGEALLNPLPDILGWVDDARYLLMEEKALFLVDAKSGEKKTLVDLIPIEKQAGKELEVDSISQVSPDLSRIHFILDENIYLLDIKSGKLEAVTDSKSAPHNPTFSPDSKKLAYTEEGNLIVYDIDAKETLILTNDGNKTILNGYCSWIYYEEIYGRRSHYKAFFWSPDSKKIIYNRFDQTGMEQFTLVALEGDYGRLERTYYPKAGYAVPKTELRIVEIETGNTVSIAHNPAEDHYLAFPVWTEDSGEVYYQWMARDQKKLVVYKYNIAEDARYHIWREERDTWVDFLYDSDLTLLDDERLIVRSAKTGWHHLYLVSEDGVTQLTDGAWQVDSVQYASPETGEVFFTAYKEDSTELDLYKINIESKAITKLSNGKGYHDPSFSTGGSYILDTYEALNTPKKILLLDSRGIILKTVADEYSDAVEKYDLASFEIRKMTTADGTELPFIILLPKDLDPTKKYPAIMRVYGGPEAKSVVNDFVNGRNQRVVWLYTAQQGIIQVWADHRGSGHHGKAGAEKMYKKLSEVELADYAEIAAFLKTLPYVDPDRIGITGGSYGGYIAVMAILLEYDRFKFASAIAPVTDWRWYDATYTERYMDTPANAEEAYKNTSALTYIDKYVKGLRIIHGIIDDNVHPQHTLEFVNKLMKTGKQFEMLIYPDQRHVFDKSARRLERRNELDYFMRMFFGKCLFETAGK